MLTVTALFTKSTGTPATSLTLAEIDLYLYRRAKADGTIAAVWTAQHPTEEIGGGLYSKSYASDDPALYEYFGYAQYTGVTVLDSNYALFAGGDALDGQEVRDAMKLAPTAGAPATGSVDKHLDDIQAKTDTIGAGTTLTIVSPIASSLLTITIGATLSATVSGLTINAAWTSFDFSLKRSADEVDAAAIMRIRVSNPAAAGTDGTLIVEGVAATVAQRTLGGLTVTQAAGTIAIAATAALTSALSTHAQLVWDMKEWTATAQTVRATGTAMVQHTPTWAIV